MPRLESRERERSTPPPLVWGTRPPRTKGSAHLPLRLIVLARKAGSQPLLDKTSRPPCRGCEPTTIQHLLESATRDATRAIGYYWHCVPRVCCARTQKRALYTCTWWHMCRRLPMDPASQPLKGAHASVRILRASAPSRWYTADGPPLSQHRCV